MEFDGLDRESQSDHGSDEDMMISEQEEQSSGESGPRGSPNGDIRAAIILREKREIAEQEAAEKVAADETMSFATKVDALALIRRWFSFSHPPIDAYMAGKLTAQETVDKLAPSIEYEYSTGDRGRLRWLAELSARTQRQYHSPENAAELWGLTEDMCEPDPDMHNTGEGFGSTAEAQLWDLYYAVLHAARRISWDSEEQDRLMDLVKTFKARPDPPLPDEMTIPMKKDWVWEEGKLWSILLMLGPSGRETWNNACGCGSGYTEPEIQAWTNVNAFAARLTASGTFDFGTYALWALEEAHEQDHAEQGGLHHRAPREVRLRTGLVVAAVWVFIAGEYLYDKRQPNKGSDGENMDLHLKPKRLPWNKRGEGITGQRWTFWRRKFAQRAEDESLSQEVRDICKRAAEKLLSIKETRR